MPLEKSLFREALKKSLASQSGAGHVLLILIGDVSIWFASPNLTTGEIEMLDGTFSLYKKHVWNVKAECRNCWREFIVSEQDLDGRIVTCNHCAIVLDEEDINRIEQCLEESKEDVANNYSPAQRYWRSISYHLPLLTESVIASRTASRGCRNDDSYEFPDALSPAEQKLFEISYKQELEPVNPHALLYFDKMRDALERNKFSKFYRMKDEGESQFAEVTDWWVRVGYLEGDIHLPTASNFLQCGLNTVSSGARICMQIGEFAWFQKDPYEALTWFLKSATLQVKSGVYDSPLPLDVLARLEGHFGLTGQFARKAEVARALSTTWSRYGHQAERTVSQIFDWILKNDLCVSYATRMVSLLSQVSEVRDGRSEYLIQLNAPDDGALVSLLERPLSKAGRVEPWIDQGRTISLPFTFRDSPPYD